MSLAPPGTLAHRRQQASLDATCVRMKACAHAEPAVPRGQSGALLWDYVCPACGAVRRTYVRQRGRWVCVRREENPR